MSSEAHNPAAAFRRLVESAGVALIAIDRDGGVQSWNAKAREWFADAGSKEDQPNDAVQFESLVPPDRKDLTHRMLARVFRTGEEAEFEVTDRHPDGTPRNLAVILSPIIDDDGAVDAVVACVRDITNRIHLQQNLSHARKMASLGSLAAGIAHHFNNMLGGVLTSVEFALSSEDPEIGRKALRKASQTLTRAARLSNSLLTFAEGDRRHADLADLTETVLHFADGLERTLAGTDIAFHFEADPVGVVEVPGQTLLQVMRHVAANAEDAMEGDGTLTVALRQFGDNEVALEIGDSGPGIPEVYIERVFEPFFTTKASLGESGDDHLGLGLAVVHGLVQEMGGRVQLETAPGEGTLVRIILRARPTTMRTPPLE